MSSFPQPLRHCRAVVPAFTPILPHNLMRETARRARLRVVTFLLIYALLTLVPLLLVRLTMEPILVPAYSFDEEQYGRAAEQEQGGGLGYGTNRENLRRLVIKIERTDGICF